MRHVLMVLMVAALLVALVPAWALAGPGTDIGFRGWGPRAAFRSHWEVWTPYLGGGLGANIKSNDSDGNSNSQTDLGVNLLGGIEKGLTNGDRFFVEGKFSLNDVPDAKVTVGWTFYH
jgi:hypothetical protein